MRHSDSDINAMLEERARTMGEFTQDHRQINMYAIYRADLEMLPGKLAAQTGHAFNNAMDSACALDPTINERYKGSGNGTKIIMYAKSGNQLIRGWRELRAAGFPCELIIDRGHVLLPHFDGQPIITALGLGPVFADKVRLILNKRFTMSR